MKTQHISINAMCSLLVGDPYDPASKTSQEARAKARAYFTDMKARGVEGISADFWWGQIQPVAGPIDWKQPGAAYYDWLVDTIIECGLKVVPILSFHQCGGNVGDDVFVPVPKWIWDKLALLLGDANYAKFVSEQGNACDEYVSFWATHLVLDYYAAFARSFRDHFADRAQHISEINISLGPAGELRYPSYNSHDKNVDYPTRGALQCYSKLAIESFRTWALKKYGSLAGIDAAWGTKTVEGQLILPPSNAPQFFADQNHRNMQYGRDLFDWYAGVPQEHARLVIGKMFEIFASDDSPMKGIDIGVKVPGIHWLTGNWEFSSQVMGAVLQGELNALCKEHALASEGKMDATAYGEQLARKVAGHIRQRSRTWKPAIDGGVVKLGSRLAELAAGLIRTSDSADWESDEAGRGYRPLIKLFAEFKGNPNSRLVMHFTCLEMADGEGQDRNANSVAQSLVYWVGAEAHRQGVPIKGENAVSWNLPVAAAWERMRNHLIQQPLLSTRSANGPVAQLMADTVRRGWFEGLTILRMNHVTDDPVAAAEMVKTTALAARLNSEFAQSAAAAKATVTQAQPAKDAVAIAPAGNGKVAKARVPAKASTPVGDGKSTAAVVPPQAASPATP